MGRTRDFFKTITETKGNFYTTMDMKKYNEGKNPLEKDIKKRWNEHTKEYTNLL